MDIEWRPDDVLDFEAIRTALRGAEVVYHLAAVISIRGDPDGVVWRTNVNGTRNVAEACLAEGVGRLVHCASVHALDVEAVAGQIDEDSPRATRPSLPIYDRSKAAGEAEVRKVVDRGLDAVVLLPTGFIGPYDFMPSRMGSFFLGLRNRSFPALVAGSFDWVDVRDVAATLIAAADHGRTGRVYLVNGHRASLRELAAVAAITEYLLFFGTPIGTEGHSGRYRTEVYDFLIRGEMWTYTEGETERKTTRPGDNYAYLGKRRAKGYKIPSDGWMLEYARGFIPFMLTFWPCRHHFQHVGCSNMG